MPTKPENVVPLVRLIRGEKVLLDADLAEIYGVRTKILNQAVKRNLERFPADFMFQLFAEENEAIRSQFVTASSRPGGNWSQSVTSMRTFVQLRRLMDSILSRGSGD